MNVRQVRATILWVGLLLVPLALAACGGKEESEDRVPVVVIISANPAVAEMSSALKAEMATRGYTEGENVVYYTVANAEALTDETTRQPDVFVLFGATFGGSGIISLDPVKVLAQGKTPIVVAPGSGDPVQTGDAVSILQPGHNVTGLLLLNSDVKRFQYFVEMLPETDRTVALVYDPINSDAIAQLPEIEAFAEQAGVELVLLTIPAGQPEMVEEAFDSIPDDTGGVFLLKVWGSSLRWYQWAYERGIPTCQDGRLDQAMPQPLMTYGPSFEEIGRGAANFVDQILDGADPGDLPMVYTEPILMVDLGIASGMGFDVPDGTVNLADTVLRSDPSQLFAATPVPGESPTLAVATEGGSACVATQISMGGAFAACVTLPCDTLLDSAMLRYEDRTEVESCPTENLVGTCATPDFEMLYYEGDPATLRIGCGFMSGTWSESTG